MYCAHGSFQKIAQLWCPLDKGFLLLFRVLRVSFLFRGVERSCLRDFPVCVHAVYGRGRRSGVCSQGDPSVAASGHRPFLSFTFGLGYSLQNRFTLVLRPGP